MSDRLFCKLTLCPLIAVLRDMTFLLYAIIRISHHYGYSYASFPHISLQQPESLLQVMSQQDIKESIEEGDRIIIDEDGNASVNPLSLKVQRYFTQHVKTLKDI